VHAAKASTPGDYRACPDRRFRSMSTAGSTRQGELFESVQKAVTGTITDVVGQEFYDECEVTLDSTFAEDIELESMEMMEIAERLMLTYEGRVDFVAWFADMELEEIIELTLGQVIDYIVQSLEQHEASAGTVSG
jgi:acyl carrier protein